MSNDVVIRVENLSKLYKLGLVHQDRLAEVMTTGLKKVSWGLRRLFLADNSRSRVPSASRNTADSILHAPGSMPGHIWALRDVSFEVKRGEIVGIIGPNGAGKTTLLKILTGITEPTEGRAWMKGRVASLLEVGTGFHPELTGCENIYLNGAILGMTRAEIERKLEEIAIFAEVEKFIDTPVKRYSSGMYVRLAFAVAAHLEPEILLIDEVLAVGDVAFQKKCLGKMNDVASKGRTVLFVSHNMGAINALTQRCIYIQDGQIVARGTTSQVVEKYLIDQNKKVGDIIGKLDLYRRDSSKSSPARIIDIWAEKQTQSLATIKMGSKFTIYVQIRLFSEICGAHMDITVRNYRGEAVVLLLSRDQGVTISLKPGKYVMAVHVEDLILPPGQYFVDVGVNQSTNTRAYDVILGFPIFRSISDGKFLYWPDRPWGAVHCDAVKWNIIE